MSAKGSIYWDESSRGCHNNSGRTPYVRGRWVGEKTINGKRVRMRSTDYEKVMRFLGMEPEKDTTILNGLTPLKGFPNYYADIANGEIYSYIHGKVRKLKGHEDGGGMRSVYLSRDKKKVVRSLNRVLFAAVRGIDVDIIPDDLIVQCSEEKGYYVELKSKDQAQRKKCQTGIAVTIERNMMESELLLGYYTKGDIIRIMEYVLSLSEDMVKDVQKRYNCLQEKARFVTDLAIDEFLASLKDGTMVSTSITRALKTMLHAAYKRERSTYEYNDNIRCKNKENNYGTI